MLNRLFKHPNKAIIIGLLATVLGAVKLGAPEWPVRIKAVLLQRSSDEIRKRLIADHKVIVVVGYTLDTMKSHALSRKRGTLTITTGPPNNLPVLVCHLQDESALQFTNTKSIAVTVEGIPIFSSSPRGHQALTTSLPLTLSACKIDKGLTSKELVTSAIDFITIISPFFIFIFSIPSRRAYRCEPEMLSETKLRIRLSDALDDTNNMLGLLVVTSIITTAVSTDVYIKQNLPDVTYIDIALYFVFLCWLGFVRAGSRRRGLRALYYYDCLSLGKAKAEDVARLDKLTEDLRKDLRKAQKRRRSDEESLRKLTLISPDTDIDLKLSHEEIAGKVAVPEPDPLNHAMFDIAAAFFIVVLIWLQCRDHEKSDQNPKTSL